MPIYAYKCASCGLSKDVLQKISDAPLTDCPACGQPTLQKQVTAAGFQLKGSGWYVTDFRGGNGAASAPATGQEGTGASESGPAASSASATGTSAASSSPAAPAAPAASAAPPAATGSGSSAGGPSGT